MKKFIIKFKNWIIGLFIGTVVLAAGLVSVENKPLTNTEKIAKDGIEFVLKNKTAKEKAQIKSVELAKVNIGKFTKGDLDIEIIGDIKSIEVNGSHGIELFAKAYKNGKQLGFSKDGTVEIERFRFFNPPVLVDDPNGDIIREWIDEITEEIKQRKLKYDPTEAIRQSLAHTISLVAKDDKNIVKGKIGNTTSTFYPDANVESTSVDGMVRRQTVGTFSAVRDGAGDYGTDTAAVESAVRLSTTATTDQFEVIGRSIYLFDTATLPDGDTISSATLSLYSDVKNDALSASVGITSSNPASNTAVVASDYDVADFGSTRFATDKTIASITTDAYNDFSLNASGISNISKISVSKFGFRPDADIDNTAPTWVSAANAYVSAFYADEVGTTKDPKLVVEHTVAVTFIPQPSIY